VRTLFLAFMIILLPLRGWIGDAMATQMATHATMQTPLPAVIQQQHAPESIAARAHRSGADAHFDAPFISETTSIKIDCADHMKSDGSKPVATSPCGSCAMCQACNTVAMGITQPGFTIASLSPEVPAAVTALRFASADRALGLKPPIS